MSGERDLQLDEAILNVLNEINAKLSAGNGTGAPQATGELTTALKEFGGRLEALTSALSANREITVTVNVDGADGAVEDLVSRVIEEVVVRVQQENLLGVTGG